MNEMVYGPHLILDLSGCDPEILDSFEKCYYFLDSFPGLIGMKKLILPYVIRYKSSNEEESGITGFVVIAESHISLHTYPKKGFVFVDIFSCRKFNVILAKEMIARYFKCRGYEESLVERGKNFSS